MISILDTTYREGKQSYLGHLLPYSMTNYAKLLEKNGVQYMEVGYPFTADTYFREFKQLIDAELEIKISVHSAFNKDNFKKLIENGVTSIAASLKFNKLATEETIDIQISEIIEIINYSSTLTDTPIIFRVGIENAFQLPKEYLLKFCAKIAGIENVTRVCLLDTDGSAIPMDVRIHLDTLDALLPEKIALGLHLHNDSGLANANFYEAYVLFKDRDRELVIDATLGGIGERNGITSIGDIFSLMYLIDRNLLELHYNVKYYSELYTYVFGNQTFNRDPLNPTSFWHSSGLHIAKFLEKGSYQRVDPKTFGCETELIFNGFTSSDAIRMFLKKKLQIEVDQETASRFALTIRNLSTDMGVSFTEDETIFLLENLLNI